MTPKEKANELVQKFRSFAHADWNERNGFEGETDNAKQCALIAVDGILKSIVPKNDDERFVYELCGNQFYWQQVKTEIENL
jgi:hypothetical protein